jgi:hypothetical protein
MFKVSAFDLKLFAKGGTSARIAGFTFNLFILSLIAVKSSLFASIIF